MKERHWWALGLIAFGLFWEWIGYHGLAMWEFGMASALAVRWSWTRVDA